MRANENEKWNTIQWKKSHLERNYNLFYSTHVFFKMPSVMLVAMRESAIGFTMICVVVKKLNKSHTALLEIGYWKQIMTCDFFVFDFSEILETVSGVSNTINK